MTAWIGDLWLSLLLRGCDSQKKKAPPPTYTSAPAAQQGILIFGIYLFHNPQRLYETYGPLTRDEGATKATYQPVRDLLKKYAESIH